MHMYDNVLYPKVSPVPIARDVKKQYNLRTPRLETKSEKWNNLVYSLTYLLLKKTNTDIACLSHHCLFFI